MSYRFNVGDTAYPAGCSANCQRRHAITIRHRKKEIRKSTIEGEEITLIKRLYSEDGFSFFPEETLTKEVDGV